MDRKFDLEMPDLNGKTILVTGGTGSFGQAITKEISSKYVPEKLIIFSRDEDKQFDMASRFPEAKYPFIRYFIGDIRDKERLSMAFRGVDYIVHAAALKHVPAAEYNPFEYIQTNVIGAENIVQAAITCGVKKVIGLSTDKAANPINLYGASKLASDKILVAANALSGRDGTKFSVVRYGNVLGSRGSIVPFFNRLLTEGAGSLPITDPRMTRFWITLPQGVSFVLSSLGMMAGGEVFVPKIPSMKVSDLASCMAPGLEQRIVGIRPGEKLHEVMIPESFDRKTVEIEDRFVILPSFFDRDNTCLEKYNPTQVSEGYVYSSDNNTEWLDGECMKELLGI